MPHTLHCPPLPVHIYSLLITHQPDDGCPGDCPRVLVCGPWVSLLWSQVTGLRSHSGSFTVTLATGHSLAPARDTRGHQHQATGTLDWTGMAGLSPTDCYWHTGQCCTALTTGLPAPGTDHTHAGEVVVFWNNEIEIRAGDRIWKWVHKTFTGIHDKMIKINHITWAKKGWKYTMKEYVWSNSHLFDYIFVSYLTLILL